MDELFEKYEVRKKKTWKEIVSISVQAFKNGMLGFAMFFTILLITRYIAVLIGTQPVFYMDFNDVLLSTIGFILLALIQILEQFRDKNPS